jgi:hypothetical protein
MNLAKKIYDIYSGIYPKIKFIRGTHRVKTFLLDFSLSNVEKIDEEPQSIFDFEWDNLIIIDGCRFDLYNQTVEGEIDYRITSGSCSMEFVRKNFAEDTFGDLVYISANPFFYEKKFKKNTQREETPKEIFHAFYNTIQTDWNEEEGTVLPEKVSKDLLSASKLFQDKKKIAHYMQPHHPFIGSDIQDEGMFNKSHDKESVWDFAEEGKVDDKRLLRAYQENLTRVLEEINEILPELDGKTVITSDHGNLLGEGGHYGHPPGSNHKPLRKVPIHSVEDKINLDDYSSYGDKLSSI